MARTKHATKPGVIPPVPTPQILEAQYKGLSLEELGKLMYELEVELERMRLEMAPLSARYEYLRLRAIPDAAEGLGTAQTVTIQFTPDYRGRIGLTSDMHVQVVDKDKAKEWLQDNGHGDLIQETVNAGSLKAALAQRIKKGDGTPPQDLFKLTLFKRASITRA